MNSAVWTLNQLNIRLIIQILSLFYLPEPTKKMRGVAKMTTEDFQPSYFLIWALVGLVAGWNRGERPQGSLWDSCQHLHVTDEKRPHVRWRDCAGGEHWTKRLHTYNMVFILGLAETYCAASGSDFTAPQGLPSTFPELPALQPEPAQVPFPEDLHGVSDRKLPHHGILWCSELPGGVTAFSSGLLPARWAVKHLGLRVHYWTSFASLLPVCRIQDSLASEHWP